MAVTCRLVARRRCRWRRRRGGIEVIGASGERIDSAELSRVALPNSSICACDCAFATNFGERSTALPSFWTTCS